jgi:hypothetical protein
MTGSIESKGVPTLNAIVSLLGRIQNSGVRSQHELGSDSLMNISLQSSRIINQRQF